MYHDQTNNVLVYDASTSDLQKVLSCTIGSMALNGSLVAIPATLMNCRALCSMNLPVPSPMQSGYDWPIKPGWTPLPHQKMTASHMVLHPRSFVFNEMGTMKTLSALWAADFVMRESEARGEQCRCIIVAPLSILRVVWNAAIFQHFVGRRRTCVLHGSAEKRRALLARDADFYIINPDGLAIGLPSQRGASLTGLAADLAARDDIKVVIVDEAGGYRIVGTRRHKAARTLLGSRPYLWLLTGTPTPNGPFDAYGLARLVGIPIETQRVFKQRVMVQLDQNGWKWAPRAGASAIIHKLLQPAIRFSGDLLNLPPCTPEQREVPFSKEQAAAYKALKQFAIAEMKSGHLVHAVNQAVLRMKLIQVAAGAVYGPVQPDGSKPSFDLMPNPRIEEVKAIIDETERKIIIFAPLTNVLHMIKRRLHLFEGDEEIAIINGEVPPNKRGDILRRFGDKESSLRVLLLDPATVSHGVNDLVTASVAIWYCPTDKSEHYQQGNHRIHRPGQTGPTKIVQLVSSSIEREIYSRLERQEDMQGLILKLAENGE